MMRDEALKQIEAISKVIESSNRFFISGPLTIAYGLLILIAPVIELTTKYLSFGNIEYANPKHPVFGIAHVIVYLILFYGLKYLVEKFYDNNQSGLGHPVLVEAMKVHKPFVISICLTILVMPYLSLEQLIHPLIFIYFGLLLSFYGRFTGKLLNIYSWMFLTTGFVYLLFTKQYTLYQLWIPFNTVMGIALVSLGWIAHQERKA